MKISGGMKKIENIYKENYDSLKLTIVININRI